MDTVKSSYPFFGQAYLTYFVLRAMGVFKSFIFDLDQYYIFLSQNPKCKLIKIFFYFKDHCLSGAEIS